MAENKKDDITFDPVSRVWDGILTDPVHKLSMVAVVGVALAVAIFSGNILKGLPLKSAPVQPPRAADATRSVLILDGNRDGYGVKFQHDMHKGKLGGAESCGKCHHLSKPNDPDTACRYCHTDMFQPRSIFDHTFHTKQLGDKESCEKCHTDSNKPRWITNAKDCIDCHEEDMGMTVPEKGKRFNHMAVSYKDAMHKMCIECHRNMKLSEEKLVAMEECTLCHGDKRKNRTK